MESISKTELLLLSLEARLKDAFKMIYKHEEQIRELTNKLQSLTNK